MARQRRRKRRFGPPQIQRETVLQYDEREFQPPSKQAVEQICSGTEEYQGQREDVLEEEESFDLEEQLEIERMKNDEARQTIAHLIQDITSYKALIEEEKQVLESDLLEERNNTQLLEEKVAHLSEALLQAMQEHEEKITILEHERTQRSSEMVGNLQLLIKELNYIEERNEELQQQLDTEKKNTKELVNQLQHYKETIDKLHAKISHLEGDKEMLLKTCTEQCASVPSDMFIQTEKQKLKLQAELQATKDDKANVHQLLEKEKMKTKRIASLVQQIVSVAEAPTPDLDPSQAVWQELRKDLHKLGEEYKDTKRHILNDTTSVKDAIERLRSEITTLKASARWMPGEIESKKEIPAKRTVSFSKLPPRTNIIQEPMPQTSVASAPETKPTLPEQMDPSETSKYPLKSFSLPRFHQGQDKGAIKEDKKDEKASVTSQNQKQINTKTESLSRIDLIRNLQAPYASNIERIQRRLSSTRAIAPVGWEVTSDTQGLVYKNKITGQISRKHPADLEPPSSTRHSKSQPSKESASDSESETDEEEEQVETRNLPTKKDDMKLGLWIVVALPLSIIIHNLIRKLLAVQNKRIKQRSEDDD